MPKTRTKDSSRNQSSDEEEEYRPSQKTQAEKTYASISASELEMKINDLVMYFLIMDQKKQPIKRENINKIILKDQSKAFAIFMKKAEEKLNTIFGINVVEVDSKSKSYILVNKYEIDPGTNAHLVWEPEDNAKIGLVLIILATIFMNGNLLKDSELYYFLSKLGIDIEGNHPVFGDVKKLITQEFVRCQYLEVIKTTSIDPPTLEFAWGQRAKQETTKKNVLDFVCEIYGISDPKIWTSQYQDVLRENKALSGASTSNE